MISTTITFKPFLIQKFGFNFTVGATPGFG
jgi:hypothetical protein